MHLYFSFNKEHATITLCLLTLTMIVITFLTACSLQSPPPAFDPRTCMDIIPHHVAGLKILAGSRSAQNIIRDMVPAICNGQAMFQHMLEQNPDLRPGTVRFRVVVEYTGEVLDVAIMDSTIASKAFLHEVRDFIMDTDFTPWARGDIDSMFIYPARFGS